MIVTEDWETIQRMIGQEVIPTEIVAEYETRLKMYHANGSSGPLGPIAIISLLRSWGYGPKPTPAAEAAIDWRKYSQDGSVRVEARFNGQWVPGSFLGFVEGGTLAIRLDVDDEIRECYSAIVRLAGDATQQVMGVFSAAKPNLALPVDGSLGGDGDGNEIESLGPQVDWQSVEAGEAVYIDDDGDSLDGQFVRIGAEGPQGLQLLVQVDGEDSPREVLAENVLYAGEPLKVAKAVA